MTIKPTCRIGKITLKEGHVEPGRYGIRGVKEGAGWEDAYFWRISRNEWKRVTILEHVRRLR